MSNNNNNYDSNIVNTDNYIKIECETQTQVVKATQDAEVSFAASKAPTEEVANLDDQTTNKLGKLQ